MWSLLLNTPPKQPFHNSHYLCCFSLSHISSQLGTLRYYRWGTPSTQDARLSWAVILLFVDFLTTAEQGWHSNSAILWPSIFFLHSGSKSYCVCINVVVLSQLSFFKALYAENGLTSVPVLISVDRQQMKITLLLLSHQSQRRRFFSFLLQS